MNQEAEHKLSKDLRKTAETMDHNQARLLINEYYTMQDNRMRASLTIGAMERESKKKETETKPHAVLDWITGAATDIEKQIAGAIKIYAEAQPMGAWAMAVDGIGPVLAAALCALIDMDKCPTVGHIWAFFGVDPSKKWEKGQKRPHCALGKVVQWKIGESFVKAGGPYRELYDKRKAYEQEKNERGEYAEQAAAILKAKPTHAQAKIYKTGKLPPGHIHSRAKRYAVKQFLADWHAEAYRQKFGKEPPLPYPIAILGHAHLRKAA